MLKRLLIAGCGYIGRRIASLASGSGVEVICMVRSSEHGEQLRAEGFNTIVCSFDDPAGIPAMALAGSAVICTVPPPGGGFSDPRVRNFCDVLAVSSPPAKIVYLSATSVYSETAGGVVTENSATAPVSAMGRRRLDAESAFRDYGATHGVPLVILRISGIYGPGRLPLMQIKQGQPLLCEEESGPSNRIHADDLAQACMAAVEKGKGGDIFNVSDGHPSSMTSYFNAVTDVMELPRLPQVSLEDARRSMSPLMFSYASESRVVDNSKMLMELGVRLLYPSLMEGVTASVCKDVTQ